MPFLIGALGTVPNSEKKKKKPGEIGNQSQSRNDPDDKIIEDYEMGMQD